MSSSNVSITPLPNKTYTSLPLVNSSGISLVMAGKCVRSMTYGYCAL